MFTEVGEKEFEGDSGGSGSDIQGSIVAEVSASVLCTVYVEQFAGFWELLNGEFEPFCVREIHEVFGGS